MNVRVKAASGLRAAGDLARDLAIIGGAGFAGRAVTEEEVLVRRMALAHDQYDRTGERFTPAILRRFAETLPGKSVLPGHDTRSLPLGRFFAAEVEQRTEAFAVLRTQAKAAKAADVVPGFEEKTIPVHWLDAGFYVARTGDGEELVRKIDLGVFQDVSIGFRYDDLTCDVCGKSYLRSNCPHLMREVLEDGRLVTGTYTGEVERYEAVEGSIVYLGAQQQAEVRRQVEAGAVDPEALSRTPYGQDLIALKGAEALARRHGHQRKSWAFPQLGQASPPRAERERGEDMDPEKLAAELEAAKADLAKAQAEIGTLKAALKGAEEREKAATGQVDTMLKDLADEYLADVTRLKERDTMPKLLAASLCEKRDYAALKSLRDEKRAEVLERIPAGTSGDPGAGPDSSGDAAAAGRPVDRRHFSIL